MVPVKTLRRRRRCSCCGVYEVVKMPGKTYAATFTVMVSGATDISYTTLHKGESKARHLLVEFT